MTLFGFSHRSGLWLLATLACLSVAMGCASKPKIDWNSRIGVYTYDQVVTEMGPPQDYARLTDGTVVAEWLIRRGQSISYATTPGGYGYGYGYAAPPIVVSNTGPNQYLRLTFAADGKLAAWKKIMR